MEENKDVRVTKEVSDIKELGNTNELKRDKATGLKTPETHNTNENSET